MTNTEWILVEKAKKGDAHAFARLYENYYRDLYRFAVCLVKNETTAEDAVSSAVLKAYENLVRLRRNQSFKSWLFQITANECRRFLKNPPSYTADLDTPEPVTEEAGFQRFEVAELLAPLSQEERLVVTLSVFSGYSSREIGKLIHKREGSVRSIKSRCFARLREQLD